MNLIKNELIKIFKRPNIYLLIVIGILIMTCYNIFQKITSLDVDVIQQYQRAHDSDKLLIENYNRTNSIENYGNIIERVKLEEYSIENNITYNILLNSENKNAPIPTDARILLMKVFNNFDIIIIFIIIYLCSTIISEEYNTGTIKYLLIKPHSRTKILLSKILSSIIVSILIVFSIVIFQYLFGGILFGFDSYKLDAIRYNSYTQTIENINLINYMIMITLAKTPMYLLLNIICLLFGTIINNIALNILLTLGLYIISTIKILVNKISKYIFIYNWDISNYLFNSTILVKTSLIISAINLLLIFVLLVVNFKNKDIKNI